MFENNFVRHFQMYLVIFLNKFNENILKENIEILPYNRLIIVIGCVIQSSIKGISRNEEIEK